MENKENLKLISCEKDAKDLLNFTALFAKALLKCGAEVYRVEDSVVRIIRSFNNIEEADIFAIENMVIITFVYDQNNYSTMKRVVKEDTNLEKITLLNDLSRKIVNKEVNLDDAIKNIKKIESSQLYSKLLKILSLSLAAPFMSIVFKGTFEDSIVAFVAMFIEMSVLIYVSNYKIPSVITMAIAAFSVTLTTMLLSRVVYVHNTSSIIIAGLLPLFPGIRVTNSMRDILTGDIVSSIIGIMTAGLIAFAMAIGVIGALKVIG